MPVKKGQAGTKKPAIARKPVVKAKPAKAPAKVAAKVNGKRPAVVKKEAIAAVKVVAPPIEKKLRKTVKKSAVPAAPPVIEVSDHPKLKVRHILISQPQPVDLEKNPFFELGRKYHFQCTFRQFIRIEGLTSQEFRAQRIDILAHGAVILTSKMAVDHYFRICNEMRITVPETMKYFCINEQTAYYLQKYIQYRKRKIFFGHGTIRDLVDVIKKNKAEKFLLPVSDVHKEQIAEFLDEVKIKFTKAVFYKTVAADLSDIKTLEGIDMLVFFTPVGIRSLKQNFSSFKQGNTRIAAFGHATAQMVKELGYRLDVFAPNPKNPSMSGAIEAYIREANRK